MHGYPETHLGIEEPENGQEGGVGASKEEVCSPLELLHHERDDHDDQKVEEPVGAGRDGVGLCASLEGVDLSGVQPGERQPCGTEEGNVGEETESGTLGRSSSTGNQAGKGDDHGGHLTDGTDEQELAATDSLNDEPRSGGKDGVDNHVDTAEQQRHVLRLANGVLEQNGEVVDDGVAATELLHELGQSAENHAAEVLSPAVGEESLDGGALLTGETRGADGVEDDVTLLLGLDAVDLVAADGSNGGLGVLVPLVSEQPSGGLGQPDHGDADNEAKDALEGNGEAPDEVIGAVGGAVVDPVGDQSSEGDNTTLNADEQTTVARLGALGLVGGDSGSVDAVADAGDGAADDELGELVLALDAGALNDDTDNHDPAAEDHGATTTEQITVGEDEHGAQQATNLVDGSDETLHGRVLGRGEVVVEDVAIDDTRHDSLIVTEEQETSGRYRGHRQR